MLFFGSPIYRVAEHCAVNKMSITNLAACFAPSLMRTLKDQVIIHKNLQDCKVKNCLVVNYVK